MPARVSIGHFFFILAAALLLSSGPSPALAQTQAQTSLVIWFQSQDVPEIPSIKVNSLDGPFSREIKFSANTNRITVPAKEFSRPLERFKVTVTYSEKEVIEFDLQTIMPLTATDTRVILLAKPVKKPNWKRTQDSIDLLNSNRQKAYGPYVTCRESYYAAPKLNDQMSTQVEAAFCWLLANGRLVFADPGQAYRLYGPDQDALGVVDKILGAIDGRIAEQAEEWRKAWGESRYAATLDSVRGEFTRLKLAHWLLFADREDLKSVHGPKAYCALLKMFRDDLKTLSVEQRARLGQSSFGIPGTDITALEANPPAVCGQATVFEQVGGVALVTP